MAQSTERRERVDRPVDEIPTRSRGLATTTGKGGVGPAGARRAHRHPARPAHHHVMLTTADPEAHVDAAAVVDTDEPDRLLELLHDNVKKYVTVAPGTDLRSVMVRAK